MKQTGNSDSAFLTGVADTPTRKQETGASTAPVFIVRQAWRVARKGNQLGCGGHAGDLEVKVLYLRMTADRTKAAAASVAWTKA